MTWVSDAVGLIGVAFVLIAYYLLQANKLNASSVRYLKMNIVGSILILYSLCFNWNLAAVLVEGMWCVISLWGMFKTLRQRRLSMS